MAGKTLKKKVQAKPEKNALVTPVVDSAKDFWFAGLGVFSVAQQESEKLFDQGTKLFDRLVAEGAKFEKKSIDTAENVVDEIKHDVESTFEDVRNQATENWDNFGNIFDERVSGTLERLGIPTTKDLNKLSGRVQNMTKKATDSWKEFESLFEKRVATALDSLNIPTAKDLGKLSDNVQKISADALNNLTKLEATFEKRVADVFGKFEATTNDELKKLHSGVQDVTRQVNSNWDKLESIVDRRAKRVVRELKIASKEDIKKLNADMRKLTRQVTALEKKLVAKPASQEQTGTSPDYDPATRPHSRAGPGRHALAGYISHQTQSD
jgi:poly(hydroxyalkanoate) granule-associated protein